MIGEAELRAIETHPEDFEPERSPDCPGKYEQKRKGFPEPDRRYPDSLKVWFDVYSAVQRDLVAAVTKLNPGLKT